MQQTTTTEPEVSFDIEAFKDTTLFTSISGRSSITSTTTSTSTTTTTSTTTPTSILTTTLSTSPTVIRTTTSRSRVLWAESTQNYDILPRIGPTIVSRIIELLGSVPDYNYDYEDNFGSGNQTTTPELTTNYPEVFTYGSIARSFAEDNSVVYHLDEPSIRCRKYNQGSLKKRHSLLHRYPKRYRKCRQRIIDLGSYSFSC